jgi:hypothetical protein
MKDKVRMNSERVIHVQKKENICNRGENCSVPLHTVVGIYDVVCLQKGKLEQDISPFFITNFWHF